MFFIVLHLVVLSFSLRQTRQNSVEYIQIVSTKSKSPNLKAASTSLMDMAVSVTCSSLYDERFARRPTDFAGEGCSMFIDRHHEDSVLCLSSAPGGFRIFRNPTGCWDAVYFLGGLKVTRSSMPALLTRRINVLTVTCRALDKSTC